MRGEPIAIVGCGCVLPGATNPDQFWHNIATSRSSLTPVPAGRWPLSREQVIGTVGDHEDRAWTDMGGFVTDFDAVFDPNGFAVDAETIAALDPVFQWTLYAVQAALRDAGREGPLPRAGLVLGNLAYPSSTLTRYAEHVWLADAPTTVRAALLPRATARPAPANRFSSGYPALLTARALRLGAGAYALDAACASSLYAIKLACDRLHDGSADLMVAGGVNAADTLFLHLGFTAVGALSKTGRSRPFDVEADGLLPAEGAVLITLMRLRDAQSSAVPIHGVIRGIGLSNDGRTGGLLTPTRAAQVAAIRAAYTAAQVDPTTVSLVECHATGTPAGDGIEIASMAEVFAGCSDVPIGSVKSNVGHLLAAAGAAGLLKVLCAMRSELRPATLGVQTPREELSGTPLRPLCQTDKWLGPRRAAVSAFGFGGNNAHLIVDAWEPEATRIAVSWPGRGTATVPNDIAIVAIGARVGRGHDVHEFEADLLQGRPNRAARSVIEVALTGLRFPPADLPRMTAQQLLVLEAAREAVAGIALSRERTMVLVGMGCDPEIARYDARWLSMALLGDEKLHEAFAPALSAAGVVGTMPNIVTNRLNAQLDLGGPSYSVCAEEASGLVALDIAASAIRTGEADAAVVGAVDLSHEPVHRTALAGVGHDRPPGDAAVVLVLKRCADARLAGEPVIALLGQNPTGDADLVVGDGVQPTRGIDPVLLFGSPHAAFGLLAVATAAVALQHQVLPRPGSNAEPAPHTRTIDVIAPTLGSPPVRARLHMGDPPSATPRRKAPDSGTRVELPAHPPLPTWAAGGITRITELHRDFLLRQGEVHQRYLDVAARARQIVCSAADRGRSSTVTFGRDQLLRHASGRISELFGPRFRAQDGYRRQTRLPEPPMLLVDRVTGLDAEPATMGTGIIRTETDVCLDSWFLDATGRMSAGILVEAGQAILMLISWLGVDLFNRGERVYRLLDCELIFHSSPPRPGDTLCYTIRVDGHHELGTVRVFSFHSDCTVDGEPTLTIRNGRAGFFTDEELAESGGVLWGPADEPARDDGPVDRPPMRCRRNRFDADAVRAFAEGRAADCFGDGWIATRAHVRSPRIAPGQLRLLTEVTEFEPTGGPWGRGYLRAETSVRPDDWFFAGHFHNDPCMPATLMLEGCLQAMAFYLAATGCTIDRDGWRFEPVPDERFQLRCHGQVTPQSQRLNYEVFVSGLSAGPRPTLYADVLCTVDETKAFHARRLGLRLVPDWPLEQWRTLGPPALQRTGELVPLHSLGGLVGHREDKTAAKVDGYRYDYAAMLSFAWGKGAFEACSVYAGVDDALRIGRLPGPPYLFVSRLGAVGGEPGRLETGAWLEAEYDLPDEAWFFDANGAATMPLAALVEAVLQPCGLLASYMGSVRGTDIDVLFRNLDGDLEFAAPIRPGTRSLRTRVTLRSISRLGQILIESFGISCQADGMSVLAGSATLGIFPRASFTDQPGLPPSDVELSMLDELSDFAVDLRSRPARYCGGPLRLPGPMLLMLDRITGFWPDGGSARMGRLRAEKDVDADDWYFKAHFLGDPVQPGSLGLEAMCQLLQFFCIEIGLGANVSNPRFEPIMPGGHIRWMFRGQVVPTDYVVTVEADIIEMGSDDDGRFVRARAWLWVDGRRIYHVTNLGMRIVSEPEDNPSPAIVEHMLDPTVDRWLEDHRPNWVIPTVPMMSIVDIMAKAAADLTGRDVTEISNVRLRRWLPVTGPIRLRTKARRTGTDVDVAHEIWRDATSAQLSRFETVATATISTGTPPAPPAPWPALADAEEVADPYQSGELFHGPAFAYLTSLRMGSTGSTTVLDAGRGRVPKGQLNQGLLDGLTHAIPHQSLIRWIGAAVGDRVSFPHRIPSLRVYRPLPCSGELTVDARFIGFDDKDNRFPTFDIQLRRNDLVLVTLRLVAVLVPMGRLSRLAPERRRAFLRDREYVEGIGFAHTEDAQTALAADDIAMLDWLPGSVATVYGLPAGTRPVEQLARIAVKDHVAGKAKVHPGRIEVAHDFCSAWPADRPQEVYRVVVADYGDRVVVVDA